jgi:lauroyl/myristoyl acyltransferase
MVTAVMMTRAVSGMAEPEGASVVPVGLLVNHDGLGLGLHEHPPKGEREGNDRYD